jgi:hypothetical protein
MGLSMARAGAVAMMRLKAAIKMMMSFFML